METNLLLDDGFSPNKLTGDTKLGKVLLVIFYMHVGVALINLVMTFNWHFFSDEELYREFISDDVQLNSFYDYFHLIFAFFYCGLHLLSIVWFIKWFRRLYANLHKSQLKPLLYKESMAITSWFIPILALYRPFQIMREIWEVLQDYFSKYLVGFRRKSMAIIGIWWFFFNVSKITNRLSIFNLFRADDVETIKSCLILYDIDAIIQLVTVLVTIKLIRETMDLEQQFYATYK